MGKCLWFLEPEHIEGIGTVGDALFRVDEEKLGNRSACMSKRDLESLIALKMIVQSRVESAKIEVAVRKTDSGGVIGIVGDRRLSALHPFRGDRETDPDIKTPLGERMKHRELPSALNREEGIAIDIIDSENRDSSKQMPAVLNRSEFKIPDNRESQMRRYRHFSRIEVETEG